MKIRIQRTYLLQAIQTVQKAVSTNSLLPVLSGIKIAADTSGVRVTATNLEIAIETYIPKQVEEQQVVQVMQEGSVVLTARYFYDIIRNLPADEIVLDRNQNDRTTIAAGESIYHLNGIDSEEFPRLPQISTTHVFSMPSDVLKNMIRQTVFATSTEEIRPVLTGVLFSLKDNRLQLVATDSHRLSSREVIVEAGPDMSFNQTIVPGKSLQEVARLLPDNDSLIDICIAEQQLFIKIKHTQFYTRLIDGQYPDITRMIPSSSKTGLRTHTKKLLGAVQRASLIGSQEIRLQVNKDTLMITSKSPDIGEVSEKIHEVNVTGDDLLIAFNAKFLLDSLRVIDSEKVQLEFQCLMSPCLIKEVGNDNFVQLLLPTRFH